MNVEAGGEVCIVQKEDGEIINFLVKDVNITITRKIKKDKKYAIVVENAENVVFDGVSVSCKDGTFEKIFHQSAGKVIRRNCIM